MKRQIFYLVLGSMLLFATISTVAETQNNQMKDNNENIISFDIDGWPMLSHDTYHSGFSTSTSPITNHTLFTASLSGSILGGISVDDGKAYVTTFSKHLYCFNAYTGQQIFDHVNPGLLTSVPIIDGDRIYFGSYDQKFYCRNATTGAAIWDYPTGGNIYVSPVLANEKMYFGTQAGKFICIDTDGNLVWEYPGVQSVMGSPVLANGKVYFGAQNDRVYCLNADTGAYIWDYLTGDTVDIGLTLYNDKVYVASKDNKVYCLDADNGTYNWDIDLGADPSPPIVNNGKLYFGRATYSASIPIFFCYDATTGVQLWNFSSSVATYLRSTPAVSDGKIFFTSFDKNIYCLNSDTGVLIWSYKAINTCQCALAIYDENVYIPISNQLLAFGGEQNQPPEKPETPSGPTEGLVNQELTYTTQTQDPEGDPLYYKWQFGTYSTDWLGPYSSGEEASASHIFTSTGTYEIKVKARDSPYEAESDWSDPIEVVISELLPELQIDVSGGIGLTIAISNIGDVNATNVEVLGNITGGLFIKPTEFSGTFDVIPPGETASFVVPVFGLGLGILKEMPLITASASCDEEVSANESVNAKVLLILVLI